MTILVLASNSATGYNLTKSLRFRSSASAYLNRTPASAGNRKTWTWSAWVKVGGLAATNYQLFGTDFTSVSNNSVYLTFSSQTLALVGANSGVAHTALVSSAVYRDPSAWYHIVASVDTTQATASNRAKLYVNGVQVTALSTAIYPAQNTDTSVNNTVVHSLGALRIDGSFAQFLDGYMTEINFIDGQALTPSSFGNTNDQTGVWQPARYTGTYGTNGFYLPFTNTTSTSTLGNDFSGNNNTWTVNNISLTSGSTYDSMNDVPTLTDATTANYPVWNPINNLPSATNTTAVISNGNLELTSSASEGNGNSSAIGTMQIPSTGKWYWEVTITGRATLAASRSQIGIVKASAFYTNSADVAYNTTANACYIYSGDGSKAVSYGNFSAYGSAWTNGDVIGVACDWDAGTLTFYKNGTSQGTAFSSLSGSDNYFPIAGYFGTYNINFGQRPFAYPLTGFKALNTFNLSTPTIGATASSQANKYMDISLYSGTGAIQSITGLNFQPDFVWIKNRNNTAGHSWFDAVRGVSSSSAPFLQSQSTTNEADFNGTVGDRTLTSLNSNGFTLGADGLGLTVNGSSRTYVAWQWRASNATAVTNTAGSITSTVSANTTSGFSIATYTGNGSSGTVGHGLGVAPSMIIVKSRSAVQRWTVYHISTSNAYIYLNETFAAETVNAQLRFGNNSSVVQPTSTVFSIGNSVDVNQNTTTYVAYCFAQIAGYSAFGSYTGNGSSNGPFVFTGFRPRFVMIKLSSVATTSWAIYDSSRDTYNTEQNSLFADSSVAEISNSSNGVDFLSNGFKLRTTNATWNFNGATYIYMAFAESPFKYANAR